MSSMPSGAHERRSRRRREVEGIGIGELQVAPAREAAVVGSRVASRPVSPRAVVARAREADGAPRDRAIVNVSSTTGLHGAVGQANYAAAKAGIVGLTKTVAKEWGPLGVRCNAVAFGMIDTRMTNAFEADGEVKVGAKSVQQGVPPHVAKMWQSSEFVSAMVPLARKGTADEAASAMGFLASPLSSYVSGHTLECTGGFGI